MNNIGRANTMNTRYFIIILLCISSVMIPRSVTAVYSPTASVWIYSDGGPADKVDVKTYGERAHMVYIQAGLLTKDGFIPGSNPLPGENAYDPTDPTIPEFQREIFKIAPGITLETLGLISGRYVMRLDSWVIQEGLPGFLGLYSRSSETYQMYGTPYVIVNRKGLPVTPQKPLVSIRAQSPVASESGPQHGQFVLMFNKEINKDTAIFLSVGGTARNGKDYQKISKKITAPAGSSSVVIDIIPIDDSKRERQETVVLKIINNKNYKVELRKSVVTITDND